MIRSNRYCNKTLPMYHNKLRGQHGPIYVVTRSLFAHEVVYYSYRVYSFEGCHIQDNPFVKRSITLNYFDLTIRNVADSVERLVGQSNPQKFLRANYVRLIEWAMVTLGLLQLLSMRFRFDMRPIIFEKWYNLKSPSMRDRLRS